MTNEVTNVPELRFPEFDEEWEEKILDEVSTFSKGKGISKMTFLKTEHLVYCTANYILLTTLL